MSYKLFIDGAYSGPITSEIADLLVAAAKTNEDVESLTVEVESPHVSWYNIKFKESGSIVSVVIDYNPS